MFHTTRALTGTGAHTVIGALGVLTALRVMARAPHSLGTVGPVVVAARPYERTLARLAGSPLLGW